MALTRLTIDGYGQVELNNVAFRRDGRIEAQCAPDTSLSAVENGMILAVNDITHTVSAPATNNTFPVALVYTAEHMYDERKPGLKNFKIDTTDDFYPRLGYLAVGDKWTTNCIAYDTTTWTTDSAAISAIKNCATTAVWGTTCSNGAVQVLSSAPTSGLKLRAIQATTMPDGTFGVKFQVYGC